MKHDDFATLDGAIRVGAEECSNSPAVYFLYKDGALVYIGKSVNALSRIKYHTISGWDKAVALPTPADKLDEVECMMIEALQPPWNRVGVDPENWQDRSKNVRRKTGSKIISIQFSQEQIAMLEVAAAKVGLTIGPFIRMTALRAAETMQLHYQQPQAD